MATINENQSLCVSFGSPSTGNKMKKLELVALEALTDLAHPAMIVPEKNHLSCPLELTAEPVVEKDHFSCPLELTVEPAAENDHFSCTLELTLQPSLTEVASVPKSVGMGAYCSSVTEEDYVAVVRKHGEKECNSMVPQPIEAEKHTDFQSSSNGGKTCASYVGTSSSKDKNMLIEKNHVIAVRQLDGKECNKMMMKPIQAEGHAESQPNPTSTITCASYVGSNSSSSRDLNIVAQDYAVVVPQHGIKEHNIMMLQPTQPEEYTKIQANPNDKKASASYVGISSSWDCNMVPENYPVCQHGEKASNMMTTKPKQVAENTGFQPYISGSRPCAPYVGNKLKRNLSVIPKEYEVVFPRHGVKECNMMTKRPMLAKGNTDFQSNPSGSKSFVPYLGTKSKPDINRVHEDHMIVFQQHADKECNLTKAKPTQTKKIIESQPNPSGSKNCAPNVGTKSRRDLNKIPEAEKEERRVRRLLANRESARQTILRRQARVEEFTRKIAFLSLENDNLRKDKEVALKKFDSAKRINESLKSMLGKKIVKIEDEDFDETREALELNSAHKLSSSTNTCPLNISNQPSGFQRVLPSSTPGSDIVQSAPQNGIDVPSQFPVFVMSYSVPQHENPSGINVSGNPSYALTFPWPIPFVHTANGIYPQSMNFPDENNVINQSKSSSSLKAIPNTEKHHMFPTRKWIGESSTSTKPALQMVHENISWMMLAGNPKVISAGTTSPPNGNQESVGPSKRQMNDINDAEAKKKMKSAATNSSPSATSSSGAATNSTSEENEEDERSRIRRQIIALTTAEARKWRKHVIRLKKLSVRQIRKA